jgi:hypothetical protein
MCEDNESAKGEKKKTKAKQRTATGTKATGRGENTEQTPKVACRETETKKGGGEERQRTQNRPKKGNRGAQRPQPASQTQFGRIETKECLKSEKRRRERESETKRERERVPKGGREKESVRESLSLSAV